MQVRSGQVPAPKPYPFNYREQLAFSKRFWLCPTRLVGSGDWKGLWRREGTRRGGGAATSILPILALNSFPEGAAEEHRWTPWRELPRRYIARRSGLDKDTIREGLRDLHAAKLLQLRREPHVYERLSGRRTLYRLSTKLFPRTGESAVKLHGDLFYGGTWTLLPTPSCRHLYIVLACLDPVFDETLYVDVRLRRLAQAAGKGIGKYSQEQIQSDAAVQKKLARELLDRRRAQHPISLASLADLSGLQRSTLVEAMNVLLTPMPGLLFRRVLWEGTYYAGKISLRKVRRLPPGARMPVLVRRGKAKPRTPTWYAPNQNAQRWRWPLFILKDPELVHQARLLWAGTERQVVKEAVAEGRRPGRSAR